MIWPWSSGGAGEAVETESLFSSEQIVAVPKPG